MLLGGLQPEVPCVGAYGCCSTKTLRIRMTGVWDSRRNRLAHFLPGKWPYKRQVYVMCVFWDQCSESR